MNKIDVQEICQSIAAEYPGWQYLSHKFKYKGLSHSEIWIDPSWVLHLSAEPSVIIFNGYLHYMVEIYSSSKLSSPPYNSTKVGIYAPYSNLIFSCLVGNATKPS